MIRATHEIHERRKSRNFGVGLSLAALIIVVMGMTVAKVSTIGPGSELNDAYRLSVDPTVPGGSE